MYKKKKKVIQRLPVLRKLMERCKKKTNLSQIKPLLSEKEVRSSRC